MAIKHHINNKLLKATSAKTDLNRRMLAWNRAFLEVNKTLGGRGGKDNK